MVAFRSKQWRAMPIPAGANQSRHSGENGKLGLEARLPAIQRKALHRRTWATAMRNRGNRIKKPARQIAEHGAAGLPPSKWWERWRAAGTQPPTNRLLLRTGTGRGRERDSLGRGEDFYGDGEKVVPTQWCRGKGLPAMFCLLTMLCPILSPVSAPRSAVTVWDGACPPLSRLLLFTAPQPGQHPSSELRYQWGLGTWVCKPQPAVLHEGPQGTMTGGPGEGRALQWGDGLPQHSPHWKTSMDRDEAAPAPGPTREICRWFLGNFWADGRE